VVSWLAAVDLVADTEVCIAAEVVDCTTAEMVDCTQDLVDKTGGQGYTG